VNGPRLASASADNTVRLWDKMHGTQMRILHGHSKSVLSLDMGDAWLLSGSADEEIRFWAMGKHGKHSITATTVHILVGHEAPVTCVRYGRLEVMSGDSLGKPHQP
jgi:WD40 repeat protein